MKLTRDQREAVLDGRRPKLTWPKENPCPVTEGERVQLEPRVWVTITRIRWTTTHWMADYAVRDDRPRLLRQGLTPTVSKQSQTRHWSPNEELGYTNHSGNAMAEEPEAISEEEHMRHVATPAKDRWAEHRDESASEEEERKQERRVRQQIREGASSLPPAARRYFLAGVERAVREQLDEMKEAA